MAIVLYTSGTTGNPKGVALGQGSLLANAWSMALNFGFKDETQFAVLPLYHAHALGFGLMTTLTTGGHLVFMERFDPFAWGEVLRLEWVTLTSVVPTLLQPLLQVGVRAEKLPEVARRSGLFGAAHRRAWRAPSKTRPSSVCCRAGACRSTRTSPVPSRRPSRGRAAAPPLRRGADLHREPSAGHRGEGHRPRRDDAAGRRARRAVRPRPQHDAVVLS